MYINLVKKCCIVMGCIIVLSSFVSVFFFYAEQTMLYIPQANSACVSNKLDGDRFFFFYFHLMSDVTQRALRPQQDLKMDGPIPVQLMFPPPPHPLSHKHIYYHQNHLNTSNNGITQLKKCHLLNWLI